MSRWKLAVVACAGWLLSFLTGCADSAPAVRVAATGAPLLAEVTPANTNLMCGGTMTIELALTAGSVSRTTPVDLMFVLDDSGSISNPQFELMRNALLELVSGASDLFASGGRVGVVLFSGDNVPWPGTEINRGAARLGLALSGDRDGVLEGLRDMPHLGGATCTLCGIRLSTEQLRGGGDGRRRVAIVITDGSSNAVAEEPPVGAVFAPYLRAHLRRGILEAQDAQVELFVVGVGDEINPTELALIADDPDATHLFTADRFAELGAALRSIAAAALLPEATRAVLTLTIGPDFALGDARSDTGRLRVEGPQLTWSHDLLRDETARLRYDVTHRPEALGGPKQVHAAVEYQDLEGNALSLPELTLTVSGCDRDADGVLDESDDCVETSDPDQADADDDGLGDACDEDADGDEIRDDADNCPGAANPDQQDGDGDGSGDDCDDDVDGDGVMDDEDNCTVMHNRDQSDADADGLGDACDDAAEPDEPDDGRECADDDASDAPEQAVCECEAGAHHRHARLACVHGTLRTLLHARKVQRHELRRLWFRLMHARCDARE